MKKETLAEGIEVYLGDCREVLPTLGKVDAVVDNSDAAVFNQTHEKPAKRQPRAPAKGDGFVASPQGGDNGSVCDGRPITGADGGTLRRDASGLPEGTCKAGYSTEVARPGGSSERSLQGWDAIDGLSGNDREDALQPLRGDRGATDPSSGRGAYEQHAGQSGSALLALPHIAPQAGVVGGAQGFHLVTDPPYGLADKWAGYIGGEGKWPLFDAKAMAWDESVSEAVYAAIEMADHAIVWGGNYYILPPRRGWLLWDKIVRQFSSGHAEMAWTTLDQPVRTFNYAHGQLASEVKEHPTQKPLPLMKWCIGFLPDAQTILDPFMGSGTTGVAAVQMGRKFIGIERESKYFDIACKRISEALKQPDFFVEKPKPAKQEELL